MELTDSGILSSAMINAPKQALYGYFPQIAYFQELDTALQSARYYYFNDGDGEGHAYEITDDIQLRNMQRLIKKYYAEYGSKNYQMKSDIYLYGDFEPIAGYDYPFTGTFWGNYYSIYSLCIDAPPTRLCRLVRAHRRRRLCKGSQHPPPYRKQRGNIRLYTRRQLCGGDSGHKRRLYLGLHEQH